MKWLVVMTQLLSGIVVAQEAEKPLSYWRLPGYLNKGEVERAGGRIIEMPEFNSLYLFYVPRTERFNGVFIYLPPQLPYESLPLWQARVGERGYLFVSILAWQGKENYLSDQTLGRLIESVLGRLKGEYRIDPRRSIVWASPQLGGSAERLFEQWSAAKKELVKLVVIPKVGHQELGKKTKIYALYCGDPIGDPTRCGQMPSSEVFHLFESLK